MIKEITQIQVICDCCGTQYEAPTAIAGNYDSGWLRSGEYDICNICFGLIKNKIFELTPPEIFDEALEQVTNQRKPTNLTQFDLKYS